MRKLADIIIILIIIAMVSIIVPNSQAVTQASEGEATTVNIEMNLTPTVQVSEDAKTVVLTLSLGSFQGVAENTQLAYQGTLAYDANIFEKVEVVGLNGWTVGYSDETKIIQGDTGSGTPNSEITTITFTLKDGISAGTRTDITISNLTISDGTDATDNINYTKTSAITIGSTDGDQDGEGTPQPEEPNGNGEEVENSKQPGVGTTPATSSNDGDDTTAKTKIPDAGIQNIIKIAIIAIIAVGLFSFIRYKTIKLK